MQKGTKLTYMSVLVIVGSILFGACAKKYSPKPRSYFRIDLPEKQYIQYESDAPYRFDYPVYTVIDKDSSKNAEEFWININYPAFNGNIYVSYKHINNNFDQIIEDTRKLAYKHTIKADAINEKLFIKPDKKVYGVLYEIEGNAASSVQFFLTDSVNHYLRGALYFNVETNKDSLAPVIQYVKDDIIVLIESFEWK